MNIQTPQKANRHKMNDIELDEIKCQLCNSIYDEKFKIPVSLPSCGHTYCLQCVQQNLNDP